MSTAARVAEARWHASEAEIVAATLRADAVAEEARYQLAICEPLRGTLPLLERYGFDGPPCPGLLVDRGGGIVLPATVGREVVQAVRVDADGGQATLAGARLDGTRYTLDRARAPVTIVLEWFTDAIVAYRALPTCRVVLGWNAENCARIARDCSGLVGVPRDDLSRLWTERVAEKEARRYRETVAQVRRAVDAEIADLLMRGATWKA